MTVANNPTRASVHRTRPDALDSFGTNGVHPIACRNRHCVKWRASPHIAGWSRARLTCYPWSTKHVFVKAAARVNNRAEHSHQPTRERERRIRGFRDPKRTQVFLSSFGPIRQHFALKRHLLRASLYRKHLAARFVAWREITNVTQTPSDAF